MKDKRNNHIELYYGYQDGEEGIYHAFSAEDPENLPDEANIIDELAALLDTVPEDEHFGWNSMQIKLPDSVVSRIQQEGMEIARNAMQPPKQKVYTLESFRRMHYCKPIEAYGTITSSNGKDCINYSSILTKLIQVAGRLVDSYASDLIITWNTVMEDLNSYCRNYSEGSWKEQIAKDEEFLAKSSYLFGFREMGVDHLSAVLTKYNNAAMYTNFYGAAYRELWRLDLRVKCTGDIYMSLYQLDKAV